MYNLPGPKVRREPAEPARQALMISKIMKEVRSPFGLIFFSLIFALARFVYDSSIKGRISGRSPNYLLQRHKEIQNRALKCTIRPPFSTLRRAISAFSGL